MDSNGGPTEPADFDTRQLLDRYAQERAKRLRFTADPSNEPQLKDAFARFDRDDYADPGLSRAAVREDVDAVIVGGGLGGLLMAARLREAGIGSLRIIEKAGDFGGTWYWNRYPGAACDIESYLYLPLLERTGYMPSQRYAPGEEIRQYLVRLAKEAGLYDTALFQTLATEAHWDEARRRWIVRTDRGDEIAARFLISCTGVLSNPKLPHIPGIGDFKGHAFHTARWDYAYTGGDQTGGLTGLAGKAVGVIGTGSSAIQVIPAIAPWCGHLHVFQRTPSSIDVRANRPTDPAWYRSLTPGWQQARQDNFTGVLSGLRDIGDLVQDGWTDIALEVSAPVGENATPDEAQIAGLRKMEKTRRRIDSIVRDPATAEALKPYYHYFCKRPAFHDEYLDAFNRPNVTLVDTAGRGVEKITADGVVVGGRPVALDCIIFATGFDFLMEYDRESGLSLHGRNGVALADHWREGPRTLYGMQTDGFPNLFFLRLAQAGHAANYTQTADEQTAHIGFIVAECLRRGTETVEASPAAVDAWVDEVIEKAAPRQAFLETCTPGHYNYEGQTGRKRFALLNELYGGGAVAYFDLLRDLRARRDTSTQRFEGVGATPADRVTTR